MWIKFHEIFRRRLGSVFYDCDGIFVKICLWRHVNFTLFFETRASNDDVVCKVQSISLNKIRNQTAHWQHDNIRFTTLLTVRILVRLKKDNQVWSTTVSILFYFLTIPTVPSVFIPNRYKWHSIRKKTAAEAIQSNIIPRFFLQPHVDGDPFLGTADTIVRETTSKIQLWRNLNR